MPRPVKALFILTALMLGPFMAYKLFEYHFYKQALPQAIGVSHSLQIGSDLNPIMLLVPFRYESCGGAVFALDERTATAIESQGIAYLDGATQGRGYPEGADNHYYYAYEPWQATPVPDSWTNAGLWPGVDCMGLDSNLEKRIMDAAHSDGAFFTTKPEGWLLLIPDERLVLYSYFG